MYVSTRLPLTRSSRGITTASSATSEGEDVASFSRVIGHTSSKGCVQFSCLCTEVPGRGVLRSSDPGCCIHHRLIQSGPRSPLHRPDQHEHFGDAREFPGTPSNVYRNSLAEDVVHEPLWIRRTQAVIDQLNRSLRIGEALMPRVKDNRVKGRLVLNYDACPIFILFRYPRHG